MNLTSKQTLLSPCCAAVLLDLDESTLRKGGAGTSGLTQVRRGHGRRQRLSFILEEIVALKAEWITAAQKVLPFKIKSLKNRGKLYANNTASKAADSY